MTRVPRSTVALRLCKVLAALLLARRPMSFAELQAETGLDRRTLYRYLADLEACELIERGAGASAPGPVLRTSSRAAR